MKLVIFDCDGTLVDSQHVIVAAMTRAFESCDLTPPEPDRIRSIIGLSMMESMERLHPGVDTELATALIGGYRDAWLEFNHGPEIMFDGAEEVVRALAARDDVLLGIATGKSQRGVRRLLDEKDLGHCFVTIQTADDAPSKPHPGMIQRALDETGVGRDAACMIGDTSFDMEMAANAGVHPVGVRWGYHPEEELWRAGARHMASNFPELSSILGSLWADGAETARRPVAS